MNSCVDLIDYAEFFGISPDIALGAMLNPDCSGCSNATPYSRNHRNTISRNINRSLTTLGKKLGVPLCPQEYIDLVDPRDCPIKLKHPVIAMGKRVLIGQTKYPICYTKTTGCGDDASSCKDMDRIGQAVIDTIPAEWDGDMSLVEFVYDSSCRRTDQVLTKPCYDYDCCETADPCPSNCPCISRDEVDSIVVQTTTTMTITFLAPHSYTEGDRVSLWDDESGLPLSYGSVTAVDGLTITVLVDSATQASSATAVSPAHFVATWFKWQLVHPYEDSVALSHWSGKDCSEIKTGFVTNVVVNFYKIDDSEAVEPVSICTCNDCDFCSYCNDCTSLPAYDWTLDSDTGELCFSRTSECSCGKPHYVKVHYIAGYEDIPDDLTAAIILRAFLYEPNIRCQCDDHDKKLEWWIEIDPSTKDMPLANPNAWPYGRTRAGIELDRILDAHNQSEIRDGRTDGASYGFFTGRKVGVRGMPVTRGFGRY